MRRRFVRDAARDTSGATAVEFAMISPVLILAIVGGIQMAWTLHRAATVRWALEKNARNLMLNPSESADTLKTAMLGTLGGTASASDFTVTITTDSSGPNPMLVATSVFSTNLSVPFVHDEPISVTSVTKVPSL
jgi:Flp pilus assembly protein TadG